MTVTLDLDSETEQGLLAQAQEQGVSLDDFLQDILRKQASIGNTAAIERGRRIEIPLLHLGVVSPLRRRDIYDDLHHAH